MSTSPRRVALEVITRVEQGAFSNLVLPGALRESGLPARDRAFVTDIVYGALRAQRTIDATLAAKLDRPMSDLEPQVRAALRIGVYQLSVGVAAHAAVDETVAVTPERARGLVNAVLRRVAAEGASVGAGEGDDLEAIGVRLSYPDWIVERLVADLGREDALAALMAGNEPPAVTLRPNRRRSDPDALAAELRARDAAVAPGRLGVGALVVRGLGDPATHPAIVEGHASPQDEASQAVVAILDPRPGERVLDVAAAPGGKATAAGERVGAEGVVVAVDLRPGRLDRVREAAARLVVPVLALVADSRHLPIRQTTCDRVLVDAPCSGLGVLRRRPEARWRIGPEAVDTLATLQRELVAAALPAVRAGGTLVYSVCTLTRAETTAVDEWLAHDHPEFEAVAPPGPPWRPWGRGALLLPQDAGSDGMFVLRLQRDADR